jgi:Cu(I)/Ag(I) efflux system membrane fusion protein
VIGAGAPLADLLVPEWGGAQTEYLAASRSGDAALARAARERLLLLGMAPGLIDSVARSGRPHPVVTIRSPIGGAITSLGVRKGMTVSQGQTLAEIDGLATVWLDTAVPETIAGKLRVGAPISATVGAFPNETFPGRISAILPQADTASHTLTVRAELSNRNGKLRPGMFATVSLNQGSREALLVPSEALIRTGTRTLVMLAEPGGRYRPAEVRTGAESDGRTEILAGLREGEKIVASGQFLIDSEASLTGIQARAVDAVGGSDEEAATPKVSTATYRTSGRIEKLDSGAITISHQPVPALGWPAMTMTFRVPDSKLVAGYKAGDSVAFAFSQPPQGPTLTSIAHETGR